MMMRMGVNTEPSPDGGSLEKHVLETPLQHTHTIKNIWTLIHHHTFITTQLTREPSCPVHRNYVKLICKATLWLVSACVLADMAFLIRGLAKMVTSVWLFSQFVTGAVHINFCRFYWCFTWCINTKLHIIVKWFENELFWNPLANRKRGNQFPWVNHLLFQIGPSFQQL